MEATSTTIPSRRPSAYRAILWAGLIAGALDITAACTRWALRGVSPARVLRGVAGGLFGPSAAQGGIAISALGLLLHFVIAFGAAAVYFAASRKIDLLVRRPWIAGPLYGIGVHCFMQFVVLPLSAARMGPFSPSEFVIGMIIHILFVGLPIALVVSRFSK